MKLSNEKLANTIESLSSISGKQLPIRISYYIAKNINNINKELKIYNEEKQKLVDKYSIKGEDGKTLVEDGKITISPEYVENWNTDKKELLSIETEIEIYKIDLQDLLNSNCNVTPSELIQIEYMLEGEI